MRCLVLSVLCLLCCDASRTGRRRPRPLVSLSRVDTHPGPELAVLSNPTEKRCRAVPLDFLFVIDSSRSIRPNDYEKVKAFIANLLQFLDIGPEATRVGLLQYGSVVQSEFSLGAHTTRAQVEQAVRDMEHLATGTMTGLAIQYAMDTAFTEAEGARPAHMHIPRIAMVVTDGRPQDTVEEIATRARQAGIQIFAIGVGRVDMGTLKAIGSEPHLEHVYLVANFSQMESLISVFQSKLCGATDMCEAADHQCQHICVSTPASYQCKCRTGYSLNPDGKTCTGIDHCADGKHSCEQDFMNTEDSSLQPDGKSCKREDLCQTVDHCCEHLCVSTPDSYVCTCFEGFVLADDGKSCKNMDSEFTILILEGNTSQSTTEARYTAEKAYNRNVSDYSLTNKEERSKPRWSVKFEASHKIAKVIILSSNSTDDLEVFIAAPDYYSNATKCENTSIWTPNQNQTFSCSSRPEGVWVSIVKKEKNTSLSLSEVYVFEEREPLKGKPYQSSTQMSNTADKAIDGKHCTIAQTKSEDEPWWRLDLFAIYNITDILIAGPTNLNSATIYIGNSREPKRVSNSSGQTFNLSQKINKFTCKNGPIEGRFVIVSVPGDDKTLTLNEVKVYGIRTGPLNSSLILVKEKYTWEQALDYCRRKHSDLVSIPNLTTQNNVELEAMKADTTHVWLGLHHTCTLDFWFWVSGEYSSFDLKWAPGNGTKGNNCGVSGAIQREGETVYWVALPSTTKLNFICEK